MSASSEPELAALAGFVSGYRVDPDDSRLRERLRTTMLDWASALIAGTGHSLFPAYRTAILRPGESGPCHALIDGSRRPLTSAAAYHAAVSHFWEVDDAHRDSTSHPGITVIPAVLALADARNLPAPTVAAAIVAGFETILRVGSHLGAAHYRINHSTATAGALGAAAGAARAIGLDREQTLWALGHAGTQAAGLWAFLDDGAADAKAFHAASAVRNGLDATLLAEAGIKGAARVLEGPRGMRASWHLDDRDSNWLTPGDEEMIHTVTVKGWPVCGQMHSALDCAAQLAKASPDFAASDCPVTVALPQSALAIASVSDPKTVAEAKFSTAFCIAATLMGKPPSLTGLTDALVSDPAVRKRASEIRLEEDAEFTARFPKERPARVTLNTARGEISETRAFRRGDPEAPWSDADMDRRTADVLKLTTLPTDFAGLIAWSEGLAGLKRDWKAASLFDLVSSADMPSQTGNDAKALEVSIS
ncbi:MmgE/PrpD family protein [Notoacmeibacter sp. MSK16QG-6]|uniref:MmgE/PrpD family protein n=1 Tax=Notoacmeibacter sp. MSK16QG-6 TaxID=2957982 RepID=UPI00209CF98A|nr:MmgE/PrpD family protein [Notoacmeibacter sp. MSK16QG-6]